MTRPSEEKTAPADATPCWKEQQWYYTRIAADCRNDINLSCFKARVTERSAVLVEEGWAPYRSVTFTLAEWNALWKRLIVPMLSRW